MTLYEQTAQHVGIAAVDGEDTDVFVPIIPKGTPYPLREPMKQTFTADRRGVRIPVYEGVHDVASRNRVQGVLEVTLPEGLEAGSEVEVSFNYDRDRILTVAVSVPGTTFHWGETLRTQAPAVPSDSPEDSRDELERTIDFTQGFVNHYGDYIEEFQIRRLRRRLTDAHQCFDSQDPEQHQRYVDALHRDVDNSGLATNLYLADIAADRAAPDAAQQIRDTAEITCKAHREGNTPQRAQAERTLVELVRRELERPEGAATPAEASDLLRRRR
jgi:molecular chaperone DnaK (HSP70)